MKLWLALLFIFIASPASAQFDGCAPGFCSPSVSGGAATCPAAAAFLARTSGLDTPHQNNYKNLICGLVTDGVWSKLDAIYTYATQDQTTSNLNLVSSSFTTVPQAAVTWAADRGYTGVENATGTYLYNGFTPPDVTYIFQTGSAHVSAWSNTSGQSDNYIAGLFGGPVTGYIFIQPRNSGDLSNYGVNNATGLQVSNADGKGWYSANMSGGNLLTAYKNGSSVGTLSQTADRTWGGPLAFLAMNFYPGQIRNGTGSQISAASIGGSLTGTDHTNLYNRLRTYMTAVGVP